MHGRHRSCPPCRCRLWGCGQQSRSCGIVLQRAGSAFPQPSCMAYGRYRRTGMCILTAKFFQKKQITPFLLFPFSFFDRLCITLSLVISFSWTNGVYCANFKGGGIRMNPTSQYSRHLRKPARPVLQYGPPFRQAMPSPTVNFQIADPPMFLYNADRCDSKPEPVQTLIRQVTEADAPRAGLS